MDPVDVALCLAVDASASVDHDEFGLMMGGLAAAFRDPEVVRAATAGPRGAAAVALVLWSGVGEHATAVDWMRIAGPAGAEAAAAAVDDAPRAVAPGPTALGEGMGAGLALLAACPFPPERLVLDVSGDGQANAGPSPAPVRDAGVSAGVTINALAVLNEEPDLVAHYAAHVIGGPGAFVISCGDYADFVGAIRRKLIRELRGDLTT
ncbi:DUF1194 domain-containing protein [Roseomonas sp. CCTCC AB2023176]|uniref:DUF1194 domain-containing protein n=1 Tax=Roseomonas sp. CCTCC AB2023176 TaxID=3342640 RepID=UPI0035DD443E